MTNPAEPGPAREWLQRAAFVAVLIMLVVFALRQVGSHDLGFHLRAGSELLAGEGWPDKDSFTYTVNDHDYLDTSWGYQAIVTPVERVAGPAGLVLLHAALILLTFLIVDRSARLLGADRLMLTLLLLVGVLVSEIRFEVRPEVFSWLLLAATLYVLHRRAAGRPTWLWSLPLISFVWVNTHALFVLGWAAMGCFVAGGWLRDRRIDRALLLWSAAAVPITILNPYGLRGALFPLTLLTRLQGENVFAAEIGELLSPWAARQLVNHPSLALNLVWLLAVLALAALPALLRRRRFDLAALTALFLPLALQAVRNVPLLAIVCVPGVAWVLPLGDRLAGAHGPRSRLRGRLGVTLWVGILIVASVVSLRVVNDAWYVADRRQSRTGLSFNSLRLPVGAADYARRAGLQGRVLNDLGYGGWLSWAVPTDVFIDSRLEVIGESFYGRYKASLSSQAALASTVDYWDVGWIALPIRAHPSIVRRMARDPEWSLAYVDQLSIVWVRRDLHPGFVADDGVHRLAEHVRHTSIDDLPGLGGPSRRAGAAHWLAGLVRRQAFPTRDYRLGLFHYFRGEPEPAASRFAAAIERSGGAYVEIYNHLGTMLHYLRRFDDASACYRVVLDEDPANAAVRSKLERARLGQAPVPNG